MNTIAQRIRAARQAASLSRQGLNYIAFGVANATNIGRLEDGNVANPRAETLSRIAAATEVSVDWLTHGLIGEDEHTVKVAGIGARIQKAREHAGMSARALATESGLGESAQNVRRLERGNSYPTLGTVERIAYVLGRSPDSLAYGN